LKTTTKTCKKTSKCTKFNKSAREKSGNGVEKHQIKQNYILIPASFVILKHFRFLYLNVSFFFKNDYLTSVP